MGVILSALLLEQSITWGKSASGRGAAPAVALQTNVVDPNALIVQVRDSLNKQTTIPQSILLRSFSWVWVAFLLSRSDPESLEFVYIRYSERIWERSLRCWML